MQINYYKGTIMGRLISPQRVLRMLMSEIQFELSLGVPIKILQDNRRTHSAYHLRRANK